MALWESVDVDGMCGVSSKNSSISVLTALVCVAFLSHGADLVSAKAIRPTSNPTNCAPGLDAAGAKVGFSRKISDGVHARSTSFTQPLATAKRATFPIVTVHYRWDSSRLSVGTFSTGLPRPHVTPWRVAPRGSIAVMNGDYFVGTSDGIATPLSAVVVNARPVFAPDGWSQVLVTGPRTQPRTTRITFLGKLTGRQGQLIASALNDPNAPSDVTVLYDDNWSGALRFRDRAAIVIASGKVIARHRPKTVFSIPRGGQAFATTRIGEARNWEVGSRVVVDSEVTDIHGSDVASASGHGGYLLHEGRLYEVCSDYENIPRPRSLIAWNALGDSWFLVAGPGRPDGRDGIRVGGATKTQLAEFARSLGATEAVALDGGGSSSLAVRHEGSWRRLDNGARAWIRPFPVGWALQPTP